MAENWLEQAKKKLTEEANGKFSGKEAAMKDAVRGALLSFCEQDGEFAQAVVQGGGFAGCMAAVAKDVGSSISDFEAFKRAAGFYYPEGKEIRFCMWIGDTGTVPPWEDREPAEERTAQGKDYKILDLDESLW